MNRQRPPIETTIAPQKGDSMSARPQGKSHGARYFALEARVLLDAAAIATADAIAADAQPDLNVQDTGDHDLSVLVAHLSSLYQPDAASGRAVLFVDARIHDIESLLTGIDASRVEIHLLDGTRDGLAQIRDVLSVGDPASSVHIISHGSAASVTIGATDLDAGSIQDFGESLREIGGLLTQDADILLYGCNVAQGEAGQSFVGQFAEFTGADVAASSDATGSQNAGGDWDLEYALGEVRQELLTSDVDRSWEGILADGWVADGDSISGSWGVAVTQTVDNNEWKFVSAPNGGSGGTVYIYVRNLDGTTSNGNWVLMQTLTSTAAQFGWDIAATRNKLVVSAPEAGGVGQVFVYTYNSAGTGAGVVGNRWNTATAGYTAQTINRVTPAKGAYDNVDAGERWGYSVDIANNGSTYQIVIGNPHADWWDNAYYGTTNEKYEAGAAFYAQAAGDTATFGAFTELARIDGSNQRFGDDVAVGYSAAAAGFWTAVGADWNNTVRVFQGATFKVDIGGWAGGTNDFGTINLNTLSIGNNLLAVGTNGGDTRLWQLDGTLTGTADYTLTSGTGKAVSVHDTAVNAGTFVVSNGTSTTVYTMAGGVITATNTVSYGASDVEIDRVRALDLIFSSGSGAQSWHYNRDPVTANDTGGTVTEDATAYSVTVTTNDSDADITAGRPFGDALQVLSGSSVYGATIGGAGTTTATYDPRNAAQLQALDTGESVVDTVTITVTDGQGGSATSTFSMTVTGVNDKPVAQNDSFTVSEDWLLTGETVTGNDSDVDVEALTYSLVSGPARGTLVFNSDGTFNYAPDALDQRLDDGESATITFTYRVYDGTEYCATNGTVTITITGVNDGPVAADVSTSVTEDQASVSGTVTATDIENTYAGTAPADTITFEIVGAAPVELTAFNTTTGAFTVAPLASDQTLRAGDTRLVSFLYRPYDGTTYGSTKSVTVTINGVNDIPVISATPLNPFQTQQTSSTAAYDFGAYFYDIDQGEDAMLTPDITALPVGWSWVASDTLAMLTIPAGASNGTITVRMRDAQGAYSATQNFAIQVDAVNNSPYVKMPMPDQVAVAGYEFSYTIPATAFSDADPLPYDTLTYTATLSGGGALPGWLLFDPVTRTFSGTPSAGDVANLSVVVTATDDAASKSRGANLSATDTFTVNVVSPAPIALPVFTDGPAANADFGFSSALSEDGNTLVVGAPGNNSVWYYQWNGSNFVYKNGITGPVANAKYGWSIDLDASGLNLVVGARNETVGGNVGQGTVYWYSRTSTANDFALWSTHRATGGIANDYFGTSVALNEAGNNLIVGASHFDYSTYTDSGAAFWFGKPGSSGTTVSIAPNILPKDPSDFDRFGTSVAFDENIIAVSATGDDNPGGMVSRLAFDDGFGNTASATFGSSSGTLSTTSQFVYDPTRGGVVYLTGSDGKVTLSSPVDLGSSWTISAFYKGLRTGITAGEWRTLTRGSADHHIIVNSDGMLGVYDNAGGSGFVSSTFDMDTLDNNVWHNIVAVGEGTTTTFYIDGVKVGVAVAEKPTDDIVAVGNFQNGTQRFSDYIDDFRVYNRALSASEIRNIYQGVDVAAAAYGDAGSIYVFSTDLSGAQVTKLHAPDSLNGDMLGWAIDVDVYTIAGTQRQGALLVASSIYNDEAATDGGAVYVWRSTSQASGALNNGGAGNGTWTLEAKLTSYDTTASDWFGNDVAVDVNSDGAGGGDGGTRLVVGAPFEDAAGSYSGAAYGFRHLGGASGGTAIWQPEKFVDSTPQGGTMSTAAFFGSSVAVADTRAIIGSRWRDNGGQTNDGAVFWANLVTTGQGNYLTILSAETSAVDSFFLPVSELEIVSLDTAETQGTVSFDANGKMSYTPGAAFKSLGLGQTATDSFTYAVRNGDVTYVNTVNVTIHGVDDAASAVDDGVIVAASSPTLINVLANDVDPDGNDSLAILSLSSEGIEGRVYSAGDALVYDPRGRFDTLRAGETATETFTYSVTDSSGIATTARVVLTVAGQEDPVVAVNDAVTVKAGSVVSVDLVANDIDADGAGTFSVVSIDDSAARGEIILNADGTVTYLAGSAFAWLKPGETATDRIVYTVRDDTGNESSAMLTILVIGENDAPTANNDGVMAAAGETVTVGVLANDVDPDGDTLRITRVFDSMTLGKVTLNDDGTISYTGPADLVTDRFEYEVIDSRGEVSTATVFVNWPVDPPDVPVLPGAVDDVAVTRGTDSVSIAVTDNDGGRTIVSLTVDGGNGTLSVGEDNTVVYTPNPELASLHSGRIFVDTFAYVVQYDDGSIGTASVRVYVNGTYVTPTIEDDEELVVAPKSAAEVAGAAVVAPEARTARADTAFVLPRSEAARIALEGLSELAESAAAVGEQQPAASDATPVEAAGDATAEPVAAKPGLSAMLGRESEARRAGVDALLRHFKSTAA